ncbi:MAG: outer membrane lipoprotein-sorting protein [Bacteroidetes bacterium]|nr:outer membrane lipoprotein-sorting protein [Bacteroidota bacterium]
MKKTKSILFTIVFIGLVSFLNAQALTAKSIIQKSNDLLLGESSFSEMTMTITRPEWTRTISMQSWSLGEDFYMIYITVPVRDKGQVFLKREQDMWNWMPSINRVIKIPPSMMMQSWMGSDFSNNDLVKQNSIIVDYTHRILGSEIIDGRDCYKIELLPLDDAAVVWGKIIMWISKDEFFQLKSEFYDDYMELVNIATSTEVKNMGDRNLPSVFKIYPANKEGNITELRINHQVFNIKEVNESFFSQQNMKNIRAK